MSSSSVTPAPKTRVLVVESDTQTANSLVGFLENLGFSVELAANAGSAMMFLTEFEPQLVLLGTYLSDMPGYELTAILRGSPPYSWHFKGTGLLFVADRNKLIKHRFSGAPEVPLAQYLFKPIDGDELRDKVARELERVAG